MRFRILSLFAFVVGLFMLPGGLTAQRSDPSAQALLRAATDKEVVDGDLPGAIKQYQVIVDRYGKTDRAVAAQALLQMAGAYQKLGDRQAERVYGQIVRDYGDQPAAVGARAKMASRSVPQVANAGDRVVWTDPAVFGAGDVSPDGHWVSETDYSSLKFILRDLRTGTTRVLAEWTGGSSNSSTFSRDGKQLAYGWRAYGDESHPHVNEIRVIDVDRTGTLQPRRMYGNDDVSTFDPLDWSPDGRWLAVFARRKDNTGQIAIVGVSDGSYRGLKTVGWRGPGKIFFSPDGKYVAYRPALERHRD